MFEKFGLNEDLLNGILDMGFKDPTPIQEKAIPAILSGKDLIGCAQTGTGKTAAFLIPAIERISRNKGSGIKCLIIAPTRELVIQTDQAATGIGYHTGIASFPVYGGNQADSFTSQKSAIEKNTDILMATPGRLLSHLQLGYLDFSNLEILILDEADRMLDMGFIHDIKKIMSFIPAKRQTLMFSATISREIKKLAGSLLQDHEEFIFSASQPAEGINQSAYLVYNENKISLLEYLFKDQEVQNMIVFTNKKSSVDQVAQKLAKLNFRVKGMHSGKEQQERNDIMRQFNAGNFQILVATDILSRGIDIEGLSHVLNFDLPADPADYVHRIGRTARADKSGIAISFVAREDQGKLERIEKHLKKPLDKLKTPVEIGDSPVFRARDNRRKPHNRRSKKFFKRKN